MSSLPCLPGRRTDPEPLPTDLAAAHAMILAERAARREAEADAQRRLLGIERLKLLLAPRGSDDPRRFADGSAAADGPPRAVRPARRTRRQAGRAARARAGRPRGDRGRGRRRGRARGGGAGEGAQGTTRPQAGAPAVARAPAARADPLPGAVLLLEMRRPGAAAGGGHRRNPRVRAAAVEGGRARAREGQLPALRGGQPATGTLAPDRPWPGRPPPARPRAGRQVRRALAADPAEPDLRP